VSNPFWQHEIRSLRTYIRVYELPHGFKGVPDVGGHTPHLPGCIIEVKDCPASKPGLRRYVLTTTRPVRGRRTPVLTNCPTLEEDET
jgi:hypothetical protein